jgi:hypothetical protein
MYREKLYQLVHLLTKLIAYKYSMNENLLNSFVSGYLNDFNEEEAKYIINLIKQILS